MTEGRPQSIDRYQQRSPSSRSSQRKYSMNITTDRIRVDRSALGKNNIKSIPSRTNEYNGTGRKEFN